MSFPRSAPARLLSRGLCLGALLCVVTLTVLDQGADRAYATPWIYLFWFAHVAPLVAVALRAGSRAAPLELPRQSWCILAAVFAVCVVLSALLSPFTGPSLLAALTPLSGLAVFFLVHDASRLNGEHLTESMLCTIGVVCLTLVAVSLIRWTASLYDSTEPIGFERLLNHSNEFPLGTPSYTAGLALLIIPWLAFLTWRSWGLKRFAWSFATVLSVAMLVSSGSRGGMLGFAPLALFAVFKARIKPRTLLLATFLVVVVTLAISYAHPRTRVLIFSRNSPLPSSDSSKLERSALMTAAKQMGADRTLLGWGPGTTPLVYPRYRATLDGRVENTRHFLSTPFHVWAELGAAGAACALAFLVLLSRESRHRARSISLPAATCQLPGDSVAGANPAISVIERGPFPRRADGFRERQGAPWPDRTSGSHPLQTTAGIALVGYLVFALSDFQLDVPIFTLAVATCAALVARSGTTVHPRSRQLTVASVAMLVLGVVGLFGHRDPAPELNVRALELGADAASVDEAVALLQQSLALNPAQAIAHYNLGWLLIHRDPAAAEAHLVAAAHLAPERVGVYFGIALARLNQNGGTGNTANIVRALALESLNDPRFLISPHWQDPKFAPLREQTVTEVRGLASAVALRLAARNDRRSRDADYVAALGEWLDGRGAPGEILARSHTSDRVSYFASRPAIPDWQNAEATAQRREHTAYPRLMRNLDLPTPRDVVKWPISNLASGELAPLFPPPGWLPAPLLLELLTAPLDGT